MAPSTTADRIILGDGATGKFYGFFAMKGVADSTTRTNAQTYMAALK